jgi:hypothetical protein
MRFVNVFPVCRVVKHQGRVGPKDGQVHASGVLGERKGLNIASSKQPTDFVKILRKSLSALTQDSLVAMESTMLHEVNNLAYFDGLATDEYFTYFMQTSKKMFKII